MNIDYVKLKTALDYSEKVQYFARHVRSYRQDRELQVMEIELDRLTNEALPPSVSATDYSLQIVEALNIEEIKANLTHIKDIADIWEDSKVSRYNAIMQAVAEIEKALVKTNTSS